MKPLYKIEEYHYQVGGSLSNDAPCYVVRKADTDLYDALSKGEFCYVFNSRQMGKSSLRVRVKNRLEKEGNCSCVSIDLSVIGGENITPLQWYKGLASAIWLNLGLMSKVNLKNWWQELEDLAPMQKFSRFLEELLQWKIEEKIVIFIDEIDSVLSLDFPTDDFFALIRFCYNQRAENPVYNRLTFALFGVTTPSDLIGDRLRTPFNIGKAIALDGFQLHEVNPLIHGLEGKVDNPKAYLNEILSWTNGQPFLTQKLCRLVVEKDLNPPQPPLTKGGRERLGGVKVPPLTKGG